MQSLQRRPSGIYVFRLAVPEHLRRHVRKSEIIESTGSRDRTTAKIVAASASARWRQTFHEIGRLVAGANFGSMDPTDLIKVATGSPLLLTGTYLSLAMASSSSGMPESFLLQHAAEGALQLFVRIPTTDGYLVEGSELEPIDPARGSSAGVIIPTVEPDGALAYLADGVLAIPAVDRPDVAQRFMRGDTNIEMPALEPTTRRGWLFVPHRSIRVLRAQLELSVPQVERLRSSLATHIAPVALVEAKEAVKSTSVAAKTAMLGDSKRLSEALIDYERIVLKQVHENLGEIRRKKDGCSLLAELTGDRLVSEVTPEMLRAFKDDQLSKVPANENKVRLIHGTKSVKESIQALVGTSYQVMSASERDKRMAWISAWFKWMKSQRWIADDPAEPLRGESVLTKAERRDRKMRRDDEARKVYGPGDLARVFSAVWFKTGAGEVTKAGTYREFLPFYYWGPLIALLGGGPRVNEVAQLYLSDIGRTPAGTWFIDYNLNTPDKKLKTESSNRLVPIHPLLLELGLIEWVGALRGAGYNRLFPELKRDEEKGYGKAASQWFTRYMASLGFPRDNTLTFHSMRHTFANALPKGTGARLRKQFTGHARGTDVHDKTYVKDAIPDEALEAIEHLNVALPRIAAFNCSAGLAAIKSALDRKKSARPRGPIRAEDGSIPLKLA